MPGEKTYMLAIGKWPRAGIITILSVLDTKIARFPISFLASCGDNTWGYVSFVVSLLVEADTQHPGSIIDPNSGQPVNLDDVPVAGTYRYIEQGKNSEVRFKTGPSYFARVRPASGVPVTTTTSSSHDSTDQSQFSMAVAIRDHHCPVSEHDFTYCHASHIIPYGREDVYEQIDGDEGDMFHPKAGIFLDRSLHSFYNALMWSLYRKGDTFYVHYFNASNDWERSLNGKALPPAIFRGDPSDAPDPALIAWHYTQTVQARIRGFSCGLRADA